MIWRDNLFFFGDQHSTLRKVDQIGTMTLDQHRTRSKVDQIGTKMTFFFEINRELEEK